MPASQEDDREMPIIPFSMRHTVTTRATIDDSLLSGRHIHFLCDGSKSDKTRASIGL